LLAAGSLLWYGLRRLPQPYSALPPLFLFVNPHVLQYVTEVKPYGLDHGLAAAFLCWSSLDVPQRPALLKWSLAGAVAVWLSLPVVFVLAAVGLYGLRYDRRWLLPIAVWLLSFAALYGLLLTDYLAVSGLQAYHTEYFLSWQSLGVRLEAIGRLAFGHTAVAIGGGVLFLLAGWRYAGLRAVIFTMPLLLALAASTLHLYSLIDRLLLFALPGIWLIASLGVHRLVEAFPMVKWPLLSLLLIGVSSTKIWQYAIHPQRFSDDRKLAFRVANSDLPVRLDGLAFPTIDYYARIHPHTRFELKIQRNGEKGSYRKFFTVMTAPSVREAVRREKMRAAERGCKVERENLYRATILTVRCPEPNSDP
jgi:hypothetical protein